LSDRDTEWLTAHNEHRKEYHEANGKTYVPLTWSSSQLANQAKQRGANKVDRMCGDNGGLIGNVDGVGENLALNSGPGTWGPLRSADNVLSRWVDDEMNWGWPNNQLTSVGPKG